jgi:hypothetical protein
MSIEVISYGRDPSSWRYKLLAKLLVGVIYTAMPALAVGAGVWAGSRAASPCTDCIRSLVRGVDKDTPPRVIVVKNIFAVAGLPADHAPIAFLDIDGNSYAVVVDQTRALRVTGAISSGGYADVFDRAGHLLRRYTATESSWQFMEYKLLPTEARNQ